ncbi:hypothetical protein os4_35780 (plasmid) [Comamonadaceae bacterium OS-4]|nr:hypothetical protein os4_35780 [Comamonadaceae bacterium OS-4]
MSLATPETSNRAPQRSQPTPKHAKQHVAADAVLTPPPGCAIDLPVLDQHIPTTITLSFETKGLGFLTDSMLNLALLGSEMPRFKLQQDKTFVQNVILAADYRLHQAISPLKNSIKLHWWGSALSAAQGSNRIEIGEENIVVNSQTEKHPGADVVVEFDLKDDGEVHYATTLLNSSERLAECESICPGFTHLLYTVLERVNAAIWPIFTPRTLWNEMRCYHGWDYIKKMCDADVAFDELSENFEPDELAEKYGLNDFDDMDPANAVAIYEEEVGGILPSSFIANFGRAAVGEWELHPDSEQESIPNPVVSVKADICAVMASMEARLTWCPIAPIALQHLEVMHRISSLIASGARLAKGANDFQQPSTSAIHVLRFNHGRESTAFHRALDDLGRGAMENGDATESTGWFRSDMSDLDKATQAISKLEQGVLVLQTTCTLLLDLFYDPQS